MYFYIILLVYYLYLLIGHHYYVASICSKIKLEAFRFIFRICNKNVGNVTRQGDLKKYSLCYQVPFACT